MMTLEIRCAQAIADDAADFAELTNMASHDLAAALMGKQYRRVISQMFLRRDNLFSHKFAHFAVVNGETAGLLYAFPQQQKAALDTRTTLLMMRYVSLGLPHSLLMRFRMQPLLSFMDMLPPKAYYLQCIAVYPQYRGQGVCKRLLAKADELAEEESVTVELDVETDNTVAIHAYRGHGMSIATTSSTFYFQQQKREIAMYRMVKTLA